MPDENSPTHTAGGYRLSRLALMAVVSVALAAAACAAAPSPTSTPQVTPTPALTAEPTQGPPTAGPTPAVTPAPATPVATPVATPNQTQFPEGSVIVTFQVQAEQYNVLLTEQDDIDIARQLLAGEEAPSIPNGLIVRGGSGVNEPWSWHIDPQSIEFADVTMEVCDGLPSHVEDGTLTSERYCPWSAEVVDIQPANT